MNDQTLNQSSAPQIVGRKARALFAIWLCSLGAFGIGVGGWSGIALFGLCVVGVYYACVGSFPKWRGDLDSGNDFWSILSGFGTAVVCVALVMIALP